LGILKGMHEKVVVIYEFFTVHIPRGKNAIIKKKRVFAEIHLNKIVLIRLGSVRLA
jgi:hypothetical protein